ncbi:MAG: arylsulfatase [Daejeonella sp.]
MIGIVTISGYTAGAYGQQSSQNSGYKSGGGDKMKKPNIVIILADDQGWGDLSLNGNKNIRTPNVDRLAQQGAQFSSFYVAPLCAPTRAGLLTGRYHYRTGVYGVSRNQEFMNLDEVTLADIFKAAGYRTGAFGKWHNGSQYPYHPNGRGFDEFYGFTSGHYANYFNTMLDHNGHEVRSKGYITDDLTNKALEFIEKNKNTPFLCYLPYNSPHSPFQVPDEFYDRVRARGISMYARDSELEENDKTIAALAMCENIDWNVGKVLRKLDALKLDDNTIVIYMSDNGPNSWRWNGVMKGRKGGVDEGGVRVPFIIRWPKHIPAGKIVKEGAAYIDILPTLADFAGLSTAASKPIDGLSLKPLLTGKNSQWPNRFLFSSINKKRSVRKGSYLAQEGELYDLKTDPGQRNNIAQNFPGIYQPLNDTLQRWYEEIMKNIDPVRWHPVGYSEFPLTVLPSQDADLHKAQTSHLSYSAPAPNSSWITNWDNVDSYASWDVDIHTSGNYEVSMYYTASSKTVGSEFEIDFEGRKLAGTIREAFDPPLNPNFDRVKREGESYEKEFKLLKIGVLKLEKGKGKLILHPTSMKGDRMMDVKSLRLKLIKS